MLQIKHLWGSSKILDPPTDPLSQDETTNKLKRQAGKPVCDLDY